MAPSGFPGDCLISVNRPPSRRISSKSIRDPISSQTDATRRHHALSRFARRFPDDAMKSQPKKSAAAIAHDVVPFGRRPTGQGGAPFAEMPGVDCSRAVRASTATAFFERHCSRETAFRKTRHKVRAHVDSHARTIFFPAVGRMESISPAKTSDRSAARSDRRVGSNVPKNLMPLSSYDWCDAESRSRSARARGCVATPGVGSGRYGGNPRRVRVPRRARSRHVTERPCLPRTILGRAPSMLEGLLGETCAAARPRLAPVRRNGSTLAKAPHAAVQKSSVLRPVGYSRPRGLRKRKIQRRPSASLVATMAALRFSRGGRLPKFHRRNGMCYPAPPDDSPPSNRHPLSSHDVRAEPDISSRTTGLPVRRLGDAGRVGRAPVIVSTKWQPAAINMRADLEAAFEINPQLCPDKNVTPINSLGRRPDSSYLNWRLFHGAMRA